MHIFFSGIGGTAIGPLALIAKQAGYKVSGSDKQSSRYIDYLKEHGISNINIGQDRQKIAKIHANEPIDWLVYTSAVSIENPNHPEIEFAKENNIKISKRDELTNKIIKDNNLKLIAIAGTHGKTTTTAMAIWLFKQLGMPVSYSVGAKISFGEMGHFEPQSQYFVLECDEFDRNFLAFHPYASLISGLAYDHHEIYLTEADYLDAFRQFIKQSQRSIIWRRDADKLSEFKTHNSSLLDEADPKLNDIKLAGRYNRQDAWLVVQAVYELTKQPHEKLIELISQFPGVSRRFEKLHDNLYTDYAHTPEKIIGAMSVAKETARPGQKIIVIYEPLTNRRMHYTAKAHQNVFAGASKIYWVPSYLAREDEQQKILSPAELIENLAPKLKKIAEPAALNKELKQKIDGHISAGDLVVAFSGGGGGSLDEWLRGQFDTNYKQN